MEIAAGSGDSGRFIETGTVLLPRAEANLTLISPQDQTGAASGAICRLLFLRGPVVLRIDTSC